MVLKNNKYLYALYGAGFGVLALSTATFIGGNILIAGGVVEVGILSAICFSNPLLLCCFVAGFCGAIGGFCLANKHEKFDASLLIQYNINQKHLEYQNLQMSMTKKLDEYEYYRKYVCDLPITQNIEQQWKKYQDLQNEIEQDWCEYKLEYTKLNSCLNKPKLWKLHYRMQKKKLPFSLKKKKQQLCGKKKSTTYSMS